MPLPLTQILPQNHPAYKLWQWLCDDLPFRGSNCLARPCRNGETFFVSCVPKRHVNTCQRKLPLRQDLDKLKSRRTKGNSKLKHYNKACLKFSTRREHQHGFKGSSPILAVIGWNLRQLYSYQIWHYCARKWVYMYWSWLMWILNPWQCNHSLPVITTVSENSYEIHIFHTSVLRLQIAETYAKYLRISYRLFWQSKKIHFRFLW